MKKTIAMLLVLVLCLGMVACKAAQDTPADTLVTDEAQEGSTAKTEVSASTETTTQTEITVQTETTLQTEGTQATTPPTEAMPQGTVYAKVAPGEVKEGFYLLGGVSAYGIDDGSTEGFISGIFDSKGTRLTASKLDASGTYIANEDKNLVWQLIAANGGFYVKNAGTGRFLYYGSSDGNAIFDTADQAKAGVWKVVTHDDVWTLEEVASGRQLSLNAFGNDGSKYLGAAAYSSSSSTARRLTFYALVQGKVTPNTAAPDPEPTEKPTEKPTEQTTAATESATTGSSNGEVTYILNTETKKIHKTTCRYADNKNKAETTKTLEELEAEGYEACKVCKP